MGRRRGSGCGSENGYQAHNRARTVPCTGCLAAHSAYAKDRKRAGKCAPGLGWPLLPARGAVASAGTPLPEDALRTAAQFLNDSYEVLTGTGAHAEHAQRQAGRCVHCSCGIRVQGRLKRRD